MHPFLVWDGLCMVDTHWDHHVHVHLSLSEEVSKVLVCRDLGTLTDTIAGILFLS